MGCAPTLKAVCSITQPYHAHHVVCAAATTAHPAGLAPAIAGVAAATTLPGPHNIPPPPRLPLHSLHFRPLHHRLSQLPSLPSLASITALLGHHHHPPQPCNHPPQLRHRLCCHHRRCHAIVNLWLMDFLLIISF